MTAPRPDPLKPLRDASVGAGEITPQDWKEAIRVLTTLEEPVTPAAVLEQLILLGKITENKKLRIESRLENQDVGQVRRLGRFRMLNKIGQGEMGVVYEAEDTTTGKSYALKILPRQYRNDTSYVERFKREAKMALELAHPNIVRCDEYGELDGFLYYAMELLQGKTLQQQIATGPIKPLVALRYMIDIADALDHAHKAGIIHRDLKPENLFVNQDGTVKILDMGLSKDVRAEQAGEAPAERAAIGTPDYMSPEQTRGATDVDGRSDIYSLGATFYHLITGRVPYTGDSAREVMIKHNQEPVPDPRDVDAEIPDDLAEVIMKMLEKDREDRYKDAAELLAALIGCENKRRAAKRLAKTKKQKATGKRDGKDGTEDARPRSRLRPWLLFLMLAVIVAAVVLYLVGFFPWLDPYVGKIMRPLQNWWDRFDNFR